MHHSYSPDGSDNYPFDREDPPAPDGPPRPQDPPWLDFLKMTAFLVVGCGLMIVAWKAALWFLHFAMEHPR